MSSWPSSRATRVLAALYRIPPNRTAHADARVSAAIWTSRRARAGGCELYGLPRNRNGDKKRSDCVVRPHKEAGAMHDEVKKFIEAYRDSFAQGPGAIA